MTPLVFAPPVAIGAWLFWKYKMGPSALKGVLTPRRKVIFDTAINQLLYPAKLRALAQTFRDEGLPDQAMLLELRANSLEQHEGMTPGTAGLVLAPSMKVGPTNIKSAITTATGLIGKITTPISMPKLVVVPQSRTAPVAAPRPTSSTGTSAASAAANLSASFTAGF